MYQVCFIISSYFEMSYGGVATLNLAPTGEKISCTTAPNLLNKLRLCENTKVTTIKNERFFCVTENWALEIIAHEWSAN